MADAALLRKREQALDGIDIVLAVELIDRSWPLDPLIDAGSAPGLTDLASFAVGATTGYAVDVPPGTYYVRVRAANALGASAPSNEIVLQGRGAPNAPTNFRSSGSGSTVTLRWNAPTGTS